MSPFLVLFLIIIVALVVAVYFTIQPVPDIPLKDPYTGNLLSRRALIIPPVIERAPVEVIEPIKIYGGNDGVVTPVVVKPITPVIETPVVNVVKAPVLETPTVQIPKETGSLIIKYGGVTVSNGAKVNYMGAAEAPFIQYTAAIPGKYYTLMMVDPDAPSYTNPTDKEWRMWLAGDIPGSSLITGFNGAIENGVWVTMTAYQKPMPVIKTGYHRYYFKLYEQPSKLNFYPLGGKRNQWKSSAFAAQHGLTKVAVNHFVSKRDFDGRSKH
jgi:hypothetical protein